MIVPTRRSKDFLVCRRGLVSTSRYWACYWACYWGHLLLLLGARLNDGTQVCRSGRDIAGRSRCSHNENVLRHLSLPLLNLVDMLLPRLALMALMAVRFLLLFAAFASASAATFRSLPHQRRELFFQYLHL